MPDNPYEELKQKQRNWLFGLPEADELNALLEMRITPSEAALLAKLPHLPNTLESLSPIFDMPPELLKEQLNSLAARGLVMQIHGKQDTRYMLYDAFFWFYRMPGYQGLDDELNRKMAPLLNRYYEKAMKNNVLGIKTRGLRTVPVKTIVNDPRGIFPYEDAARIIDSARTICVTSCSCRHRMNLDPDRENCRHEIETCLHTDALASYLTANNIGRKIDAVEANEILSRAADAGLVHAVSNMRKGVDTICNCCSCCCAFISTRSQQPGHQPSSYALAVDNAACKGCGLCAKRCPAGAIRQTYSKSTASPEAHPGDTLSYDNSICLGCGVCANKCPGGALRLEAKEHAQSIPDNAMEFTQRILIEQGLNPLEIIQKNALPANIP